MEEFYENAAKLIYDYSIKGLIADKLFVARIIEDFSRAIHVDNYLASWKLTYFKYYQEIGSYNPILRSVNLNMAYFTEELPSIFNKSVVKVPELDYYLFINTMVVKTIVHELTHTYQFKYSFSNKNNDMEKDLYLLSFKKYEASFNAIIHNDPSLVKQKKDESFYSKIYTDDIIYYYSLPCERIAHIAGAKAKKSILSLITNNPNLNDNAERFLDIYWFIGYGKYCPLAYVLAINNSDRSKVTNLSFKEQLATYDSYCKSLVQKEKLSLSKRLAFGLPLTDEEIAKNNSKIEQANSFLDSQKLTRSIFE